MGLIIGLEREGGCKIAGGLLPTVGGETRSNGSGFQGPLGLAHSVWKGRERGRDGER
jgi:hypothetical protein